MTSYEAGMAEVQTSQPLSPKKSAIHDCLENCCRYGSGVVCPSRGTCCLGHKIIGRGYIEFARVKGITKRRPAVWMKSKDEVFLRCPCCDGMNMVHAEEVNHRGYVRTYPQGRLCTTCYWCKSHFYACLGGWKG